VDRGLVLVARLSDVQLLKNVTGFGLYDQEVVEQFRRLDDSYPYMRGIISVKLVSKISEYGGMGIIHRFQSFIDLMNINHNNLN
jgi:hypothetical protein